MRVYTVHVPPYSHRDRDAILVKEGFCWPAFVFGILWALLHRLWLAALGIAVVLVIVGAAMDAFGLDALVQSIVSVAIAFLIGSHGNDWRRRKLARLGYRDAGVVAAHNLDEALRRYLDSEPERVSSRSRLGPPPQPPLMPLAGV
jgi:hypothetical protein